jgi:GNAT superfamily N-acetyltransferase
MLDNIYGTTVRDAETHRFSHPPSLASQSMPFAKSVSGSHSITIRQAQPRDARNIMNLAVAVTQANPNWLPEDYTKAMGQSPEFDRSQGWSQGNLEDTQKPGSPRSFAISETPDGQIVATFHVQYSPDKFQFDWMGKDLKPTLAIFGFAEHPDYRDNNLFAHHFAQMEERAKGAGFRSAWIALDPNVDSFMRPVENLGFKPSEHTMPGGLPRGANYSGFSAEKMPPYTILVKPFEHTEETDLSPGANTSPPRSLVSSNDSVQKAKPENGASIAELATAIAQHDHVLPASYLRELSTLEESNRVKGWTQAQIHSGEWAGGTKEYFQTPNADGEATSYSAIAHSWPRPGNGTRDTQPPLWIEALGVHPDHRQKELAERHLSKIENIAQENGYGALYTKAFVTDENQKALFEKLGFTRTSQSSDGELPFGAGDRGYTDRPPEALLFTKHVPQRNRKE